MRRIALDTETTGIYKDDRIIEIGAVELEHSNSSLVKESNGQAAPTTKRAKAKGVFHYFINPGKKIHPDAVKVHGISNKFLEDKPAFADMAEEFLDFIKGATLIIHNAPFDLYYLNFELALLAQKNNKAGDKTFPFTGVESLCAKVEDTLAIAQGKYPGQSNSLDALISRLGIDASSRAKRHGALIDARLLGNVYEAMCLTQSGLDFSMEEEGQSKPILAEVGESEGTLRVIEPSAEELAAHQKIMEQLGNVTT